MPSGELLLSDQRADHAAIFVRAAELKGVRHHRDASEMLAGGGRSNHRTAVDSEDLSR